MKSKSHVVGVWMASGALVGALIGAVIGVFSYEWSWIVFGVPIGLAIGFGIGAARTVGSRLHKDKNATENKNLR